MSVPTISRDELKQKIDGGERFTLVETLPEFMYKQRHLPGALNLPPNEVQQRAAAVLPDKNAEIVVYCGGFT
jgi:rhodanese-related sulfurtransferase